MVNRYGRAVMAVGLAVVLAGCGSGSGTDAPASSPSNPAAASASSIGSPATPPGTTFAGSQSVLAGSTASAAAAAYCVDQGGQVQTRTADWGTNSDQQSWFALGGTTDMCRFQANDEGGSRIYVDLTTLYSAQPSLAGLAYLAKEPMAPSAGGANPATGYCSDLGGSSAFGSGGASGGGWVSTDDPVDTVVALCVFPDLSFIDEWGLAYHSNGDIRGADLASLMKYQPGADVPPVFVEQAPTPTS